MAAGVVLKLKFDTMSGSKTWTFRHAKQSAGTANVKALGQAMVTNGSVFEHQPIRMTDAREVITSENVYDLNS